MPRATTVLLPSLLAILTAPAATARLLAQEPPPVFDKRPYAEARKAAEDAKRWFIVKATATWCGPCKQMDKTTWRDAKVVQWIEGNAVAVAFDVDQEAKLAQDLSIESMPTMIAFKDGKEFDRVVGYQAPDEFLTWLQGIARGEKSIERIRKRAGTRDAPGEKVDVRARLDLARELARTGKQDEAADEYVWLWQHMLEHDEAFYGVRLSFMVGDMQRLAQSHEGSKKRFTALRDETGTKLEAEKVDADDLVDWVHLNQVIGDGKATLAWFNKVKDQPRWLPLVRRVSRELQELLIETKQWQDIGRMFPDPVAELNQVRAVLNFVSPKHRKDMEDHVQREWREKARVLYAGLLAADREQDAEKLAERARKVDDSAAMLAGLVSTALEAGQPRSQHVQWIDSAATKDASLGELRARLQSALDAKK